jgi:preprotein translocase subunit SecA
MAEKAANYGPEVMRNVEKSLLLQILDQTWKEHLLHLDHLRQGINLRAYGQRDPFNEYKREAFEMFEQMLIQLRLSVTTVLLHVEIQLAPAEDLDSVFGRGPQEMRETRHDPALAPGAPPGSPAADGGGGLRSRAVGQHTPPGAVDANDAETWGKTQRNAPCPCGSGKKYKHCHGKV